jgi:hypothetical protein
MIGTTTTIVITTGAITTAIEVSKCGGAGFSLHRQLFIPTQDTRRASAGLLWTNASTSNECLNCLPSRLHRVRRGRAV